MQSIQFSHRLHLNRLDTDLWIPIFTTGNDDLPLQSYKNALTVGTGCYQTLRLSSREVWTLWLAAIRSHSQLCETSLTNISVSVVISTVITMRLYWDRIWTLPVIKNLMHNGNHVSSPPGKIRLESDLPVTEGCACFPWIRISIWRLSSAPLEYEESCSKCIQKIDSTEPKKAKIDNTPAAN